jgi:hypothetical protein
MATYRLRVSENKMLRGIPGSKKREKTEEQGKYCFPEVLNLYCSPNVVMVII